MIAFVIIFVLAMLVLIGVSVYTYQRRKQIDEMHGMMVGMTFGMIAGLLAATLYLIPTGNFLYGVIFGSIVGLLFGVPFGRLGGHMGIVEGIIAGPMGGMMGAMLGQMIRPFSIDIFMPFFIFIILISLLGISYAVHCGVSCCKTPGKKPGPVSNSFKIVWGISSVVLIIVSILLSFSLSDAVPSPAQGDVKLPAYLQKLNEEEHGEAVMKDGYQEIEMKMSNSAYHPNTIIAKKGVPLKISIIADSTAGCAREILFPDFNIRRIIPENEPTIIELALNDAGIFKFMCSMDMARGKIVVS